MQAGSLFSPSEYTAALLMHVRSQAASAPPANALELGTGSGVVLALMLALGAKQALGVDIEVAKTAGARRRYRARTGGARRYVDGMW